MGIAVETASRRVDLVEKARNAGHIGYLTGMDQSAKKAGDPFIPANTSVETFVEDMVRIASRAELFTATRDMMELAVAASLTLPPQTVEPFDLPADDGYFRLPVPLPHLDVRSEMQYISTVMWSRRISKNPKTGKRVEGLALWLFTDLGATTDKMVDSLSAEDLEKMLLDLPSDSLLTVSYIPFGQEIWAYRDTVEGSRENIDIFNSSDTKEADYKSNGDGTFTITVNGATVLGAPNPVLQFLQTYWHLCKSELTETETDPLPRQLRRAAQRKGLPTGPVSVVMMRKKKYQAKGGGGWKLEYRYIRRHHWRKQWYGSGDAKYQRHILIAAAVVGPDGAPWRETPVVNLLGR